LISQSRGLGDVYKRQTIARLQTGALELQCQVFASAGPLTVSGHTVGAMEEGGSVGVLLRDARQQVGDVHEN
jgi:hypothetical protein